METVPSRFKRNAGGKEEEAAGVQPEAEAPNNETPPVISLERIPIVDQAIELATMLPEGTERTELLKRAAIVWALYTAFATIEEKEPDKNENPTV